MSRKHMCCCFGFIQNLHVQCWIPELRQSLPELAQTSTASQCRRSYRSMFCFTFSWTSLLKHLLLRAFLADHPPKKALKSRCFRSEVHEKEKKTSRDSSTLAKSMGALLQNMLFGTRPAILAIPRIPAKRRSGPLLGALA